MKELDNSRFKFWYIGKIRLRNEMKIIVDKDWKKNIVDVKNIDDRIIDLKFEVEQDTFNVINAYIPEVELA